MFLCNQKLSPYVSLMKILKSTVTKKIILCFYNLSEKKILKVAPLVIFPTCIKVLFKIHQRFKGHFLNELRVSFKPNLKMLGLHLYSLLLTPRISNNEVFVISDRAYLKICLFCFQVFTVNKYNLNCYAFK